MAHPGMGTPAEADIAKAGAQERSCEARMFISWNFWTAADQQSWIHLALGGVSSNIYYYCRRCSTDASLSWQLAFSYSRHDRWGLTILSNSLLIFHLACLEDNTLTSNEPLEFDPFSQFAKHSRPDIDSGYHNLNPLHKALFQMFRHTFYGLRTPSSLLLRDSPNVTGRIVFPRHNSTVSAPLLIRPRLRKWGRRTVLAGSAIFVGWAFDEHYNASAITRNFRTFWTVRKL